MRPVTEAILYASLYTLAVFGFSYALTGSGEWALIISSVGPFLLSAAYVTQVYLEPQAAKATR